MANEFKVKNGLVVEGNSETSGFLKIGGTNNTSGDIFLARSTAGSDAFLIKDDGRVGIVNTGPQYLLDVYPPGTSSDWFSGIRAPHISTEGSFNNVADIFNGASIKSKIGFPVSEVPYANTDIAFYTTDTLLEMFPYHTDMTSEKMRITHDGYVGIGTDTPDEKLDVVGNITADGYKFNTTPAVDGQILFVTATGDIISLPNFVLDTTNFPETQLKIFDGGIFKLITGTGPIIDVSGPLDYLQFGGGAYGIRFDGVLNNIDIYHTTGTQMYFDTASQFVGIGTTSPQFKLDVRGGISFGDGNYGTIYDPNGKNYISYEPDFFTPGAINLIIDPTGGGMGPSKIGYGINPASVGVPVTTRHIFGNGDVFSSGSIESANYINAPVIKQNNTPIEELMIAYSIALG